MTTISKAQVKLVRSLQHKKFRDQTGLFVAEGEKCAEELRKSFACALVITPDNATRTEIEQMSSLRAPQGYIAVLHQRKENLPRQAEGLVLALDGIQDPGNLGTIIRTADWFGVRDIVCSANTADCYNPKVVQATMGSLARVHVHYTNLCEWLGEQQCPIYGTLLEGDDMYTKLSAAHATQSNAVIIMGNEGNGISLAVRKTITEALRIPSYPASAETGESLNVGIATAIVLAEFRRPKKQRHAGNGNQ